MTLKGQARTDYMREYMRRRRGAAKKPDRPGAGSVTDLEARIRELEGELYELQGELAQAHYAYVVENGALRRQLEKANDEIKALQAQRPQAADAPNPRREGVAHKIKSLEGEAGALEGCCQAQATAEQDRS